MQRQITWAACAQDTHLQILLLLFSVAPGWELGTSPLLSADSSMLCQGGGGTGVSKNKTKQNFLPFEFGLGILLVVVVFLMIPKVLTMLVTVSFLNLCLHGRRT